MTRFSEKIIIVTGSTMGVGKAIATLLHEMGATVVITGRQIAGAQEVALSLDPSEKKAIPMEMEVKDPVSVQHLVNETMKRFGRLDGMVNNAGITGPHNIPVCDYPIEEWYDIINTDLTGMFFCLKFGIPAIIQSGGGSIVNLSSVNGITGIAGIAPYTTAKHGVIGLTRSAALEYAEKGVRINAVGPGYVATEKMQALPETVRKQMADSHPMKRLATGREIAHTVAFLLSDESSFTTGAFYPIDGGYTAQ